MLCDTATITPAINVLYDILSNVTGGRQKKIRISSRPKQVQYIIFVGRKRFTVFESPRLFAASKSKPILTRSGIFPPEQSGEKKVVLIVGILKYLTDYIGYKTNGLENIVK